MPIACQANPLILRARPEKELIVIQSRVRINDGAQQYRREGLRYLRPGDGPFGAFWLKRDGLLASRRAFSRAGKHPSWPVYFEASLACYAKAFIVLA
jgi:hypothetical protein